MKYLIGFVCGMVLSSVAAYAIDAIQFQQQLNTLRQAQQLQQLQYNEQLRQRLQHEADVFQGKSPC